MPTSLPPPPRAPLSLPWHGTDWRGGARVWVNVFTAQFVRAVIDATPAKQ